MKTFAVKDGQSIYDVANQVYGSFSGVFLLLADNSLSLDTDLFAGQVLLVREITATPIAQFFSGRNQSINNSDQAGSSSLALSITLSEVGNVLRGRDGFARVEVSGGQPPYAYAWSNGQVGQHLVATVEGDYTLTVTDSAGTFRTRSVSIITADPNEYLVDENGNFITDQNGDRIVIGYGR